MTERLRNTALSRREQEVALLVSEALTNREIGRRLYVGESTIKNHVWTIARKLRIADVQNPRVLIARWVWEQEECRCDSDGMADIPGWIDPETGYERDEGVA